MARPERCAIEPFPKVVYSPGLREPVVWIVKETVRGIDGPFRLRVNVDGLRSEDAQLYALYLTAAG